MCRVGIVIVLLLFCNVSSASVSSWQWDFKHWLSVGTGVDAIDGYDISDVPPQAEPWALHLGVYHETGVDGWTGPTGFYSRDLRAPLDTIPGTSKTWRIYLWADPSLDPSRTTIGLSWFGSGVPQDALQQIQYKLTYVRRAVGVTDDWNVEGTSVVFNDWPDGGSWAVPAVRINNGLDGYIFDLTATVVPEPSALAALGAGLVGVVVRRKRR